jgi:DNA modification methylase
LIGIPWMLAFALRDDGWYLRQEIIWHKTCGRPENATDRPTRNHEQIFLFSKSRDYYFDMDAIKERAVSAGQTRNMGGKAKGNINRNDGKRFVKIASKRNKRTVWAISPVTRRSKNHHAMFPIQIPDLCLKAGCPEGGIVLDPFSGTATTGSAALLQNRKYQGIELNSDYAQVGASMLVDDGSVMVKSASKQTLGKILSGMDRS